MGFVWVYVVLVLCAACVALYACGVRRFYVLLRVCLHFTRFSSSLPTLFAFSLCLTFFVCSLVVLLCSGCFSLLSFLGCVCVFFFPFGLYAKRKGARVLPCVLACLVVGCFIWLLLCIPCTRQVSAHLYRNKVLEKGNPIECSKLFCARMSTY